MEVPIKNGEAQTEFPFSVNPVCHFDRCSDIKGIRTEKESGPRSQKNSTKASFPFLLSINKILREIPFILSHNFRFSRSGNLHNVRTDGKAKKHTFVRFATDHGPMRIIPSCWDNLGVAMCY